MLGDNINEAAFARLYERARSARAQSRDARAQFVIERERFAELRTELVLTLKRAEIIRQIWLNRDNRVDFTAHARLVARLASMPVIEQAKGIVMAQCGWSAEESFEALKRASQRTNVKLRVLAEQVVAATADSAARQARPAQPARGGSHSVLPLPEPGPLRAELADPAPVAEPAEY